jgi:hypothetical protein
VYGVLIPLLQSARRFTRNPVARRPEAAEPRIKFCERSEQAVG